MARLIVQTPEGVEIRQDLAGAGSRAAAATIDGLIFAAAATAIGLVLVIVNEFVGGAPTNFLIGLFGGGLLLLGLAYHCVWHVLRDGQTPGKRLVGIRVVSADGSPATTIQNLLRALILVVDLLPVPVPLGLLLTAISPRHTRLGDMAAGTFVLHVAKSEAPVEPWPTELWSTLAVKVLPLEARAAHALDARDVAFLRDLATRRDLDAGALKPLLQRTANVYCAKLGVAPPAAEAGTVVRELYVFAREFAAETEPVR